MGQFGSCTELRFRTTEMRKFIKKWQPAATGIEAGKGFGDALFDEEEVSRIWRPNGTLKLELLFGKYKQFSFSDHFHPVLAFGVVESGVMRTVVRGATHIAPSRTVIFFNPGDVHAPHGAGPEGWSFRMFYPDNDLLQQVSRQMLWADTSFWFRSPFVQNPRLASRLLRLHRYCERYQPTLESESLLASCLAEIARYTLSPFEANSSDVGHARIETARNYLHAHCHENVTLQRLAAAAGLSPYHLLRAFRDRVGLTPHAYMTQLRVERARVLLRSGLSLSETTYQTGFVDQSHFTRQFKKMMGVTPGQYLPLARKIRRAAGGK